MKFICSVLTAMLLLSAALFCEAGTILVATSEYPPFCGSCLLHNGFFNHVVKRSFESEGINVKYEYYPWARAFKLASTGVVPAVSYIYNTRERRENYLMSDLIIYEEIDFLLLSPTKLKGNNLKEALKGLTVGLTGDYSQPEQFMKLVEENEVDCEYAKTDRLNVGKLLKSRVDAVLINRNVGKHILEKYFPGRADEVYFDKRFSFKQQGVLGFPIHRPASPYLVDKFNKGLRRIKESGEFDKMYRSFLDGAYSECR